jgi:hypothetical protein
MIRKPLRELGVVLRLLGLSYGIYTNLGSVGIARRRYLTRVSDLDWQHLIWKGNGTL